MTQSPDLVGTIEAAQIIGKSARTVHRLVKAGDLVPAHIAPGGFAGVYLFTRADVEKIRDSAETSTAAQ